MKIAIIGGGALGLLFAHYLNENHQVCVYVRSNQQAAALSKEGLIFESDGQRTVRPICSAIVSDWKGDEDLTIIAVKQYHVQKVLQELAKLAPLYDGSYLFIQNGMGHLKWLSDIKADQIFVGSVEHGANKKNGHHVIHTGNGLTRIAIYKGHSFSIMDELIEGYSDSFPFVYEPNYQDMLVKKLIVNAVINPLTAVLNVHNGELLDNPHYYQIFRSMFREISAVLNIENTEDEMAHLENICRKTAANRSSMLQDIDANRPTEVDAILGYVMEKANEMRVKTPLTEIFYHAIKGKEY